MFVGCLWLEWSAPVNSASPVLSEADNKIEYLDTVVHIWVTVIKGSVYVEWVSEDGLGYFLLHF